MTEGLRLYLSREEKVDGIESFTDYRVQLTPPESPREKQNEIIVPIDKLREVSQLMKNADDYKKKVFSLFGIDNFIDLPGYPKLCYWVEDDVRTAVQRATQ